MPSYPLPDHVLITGSASGIGRRLALDLLSRGARVHATDLDIAGLKSLAQEHEARPTEGAGGSGELQITSLDVTDSEAWESVIADAEADAPLDTVLNVAGYLRPSHLADATDVDVHRQIDINLKGVAFGTRAAARVMTPRRRGHIVNIASMAALAPIPGLTLYSATKYAVRALSLATAEELRPHGIAVTAVCPDAVQTPMLDLQVGYDEAALTFSAPRFLTVDDVSQAILGQVMRKRPLLYVLPRHRGWLARAADLFPNLSRRIAPVLEKKGRAAQEARR